MNDILDKIRHGEYALPTPPEKTRKRDAWTAYRAECAKVTARFKADLIAVYELTNHPQAERIYALAEDYANGAGLGEIANYFDDLAGLVKSESPPLFNAIVSEEVVYHAFNGDSEDERGWFLRQSLANKAASTIAQGEVNCARLLVVNFEGKNYALGESILSEFQTPDEIKASALAKIKSAGLTPEEAQSIGVALPD